MDGACDVAHGRRAATTLHSNGASTLALRGGEGARTRGRPHGFAGRRRRRSARAAACSRPRWSRRRRPTGRGSALASVRGGHPSPADSNEPGELGEVAAGEVAAEQRHGLGAGMAGGHRRRRGEGGLGIERGGDQDGDRPPGSDDPGHLRQRLGGRGRTSAPSAQRRRRSSVGEGESGGVALAELDVGPDRRATVSIASLRSTPTTVPRADSGRRRSGRRCRSRRRRRAPLTRRHAGGVAEDRCPLGEERRDERSFVELGCFDRESGRTRTVRSRWSWGHRETMCAGSIGQLPDVWSRAGCQCRSRCADGLSTPAAWAAASARLRRPSLLRMLLTWWDAVLRLTCRRARRSRGSTARREESKDLLLPVGEHPDPLRPGTGDDAQRAQQRRNPVGVEDGAERLEVAKRVPGVVDGVGGSVLGERAGEFEPGAGQLEGPLQRGPSAERTSRWVAAASGSPLPHHDSTGRHRRPLPRAARCHRRLDLGQAAGDGRAPSTSPAGRPGVDEQVRGRGEMRPVLLEATEALLEAAVARGASPRASSSADTDSVSSASASTPSPRWANSSIGVLEATLTDPEGGQTGESLAVQAREASVGDPQTGDNSRSASSQRPLAAARCRSRCGTRRRGTDSRRWSRTVGHLAPLGGALEVAGQLAGVQHVAAGVHDGVEGRCSPASAAAIASSTTRTHRHSPRPTLTRPSCDSATSSRSTSPDDGQGRRPQRQTPRPCPGRPSGRRGDPQPAVQRPRRGSSPPVARPARSSRLRPRSWRSSPCR